MAKVAFISHASEDAAIAATITDYLENNGVSCWIAPRDLTPGREYSSAIVDGIESSAVFVLVLSENANESIFVKREVERAVSKGKPVFPIRVREVMPSRSLELFISSAHWIDAWKPPMEKYLERLAQSISAAAAVYPAGAPSAPTGPTVARSWSAAKPRRLPAAVAAAFAVLLLAGAGWYAYGLLGRSGPARSPADLVTRGSDLPESSRAGVAAPTAQQVAPAAGPGAPGLQQAALPDAVAPTSSSGASELCPSSLIINRDLPMPFTCTSSGEAARRSNGTVWGTDVYTDDPDLCRAAVHAGAIGADGGPITVARSEGRSLYVGSSRNGVASNDYGSYDVSIAFAGTASPPPGAERCPGSLVINRNLATPFTCTCSGEAARRSSGTVWGTDVYTDDSDLCRAALHAGAIGADGGAITVARSEGRAFYVGSSRNGVASNDYGSYDASIAFR
jgi:hypothetical protein